MNSTENKNITRPEENSKSKKNRNFYIALTLCIAAVSAAGWSTYQSVKNFLSPVGVNSKAKRTDSQKSDKHKKNQELSELSDGQEKDGSTKKPQNLASKQNAGSGSIGTEETKAVSAEAGENLIIERSAVLLSCVCRFSKRHMDFLFWIDCKKVLW